MTTDPDSTPAVELVTDHPHTPDPLVDSDACVIPVGGGSAPCGRPRDVHRFYTEK